MTTLFVENAECEGSPCISLRSASAVPTSFLHSAGANVSGCSRTRDCTVPVHSKLERRSVHSPALGGGYKTPRRVQSEERCDLARIRASAPRPGLLLGAHLHSWHSVDTSWCGECRDARDMTRVRPTVQCTGCTRTLAPRDFCAHGASALCSCRRRCGAVRREGGRKAAARRGECDRGGGRWPVATVQCTCARLCGVQCVSVCVCCLPRRSVSQPARRVYTQQRPLDPARGSGDGVAPLLPRIFCGARTPAAAAAAALSRPGAQCTRFGAS